MTADSWWVSVLVNDLAADSRQIYAADEKYETIPRI